MDNIKYVKDGTKWQGKVEQLNSRNRKKCSVLNYWLFRCLNFTGQGDPCGLVQRLCDLQWRSQVLESRGYTKNRTYRRLFTSAFPKRGICPHIREICTQNFRMFTPFSLSSSESLQYVNQVIAVLVSDFRENWAIFNDMYVIISRKLCAKQSRTPSGSHFVTRNPRDPSFSWPVTRMTHDPWPRHSMSRSRLITNHDEFTTIAFSSLQWRAIWNSGYGLRLQWIFFIVCTVSLVLYTLHGNRYKLNTVNSSLFFFILTSYTFTRPLIMGQVFNGRLTNPWPAWPIHILLTHSTHGSWPWVSVPLSVLTQRGVMTDP